MNEAKIKQLSRRAFSAQDLTIILLVIVLLTAVGIFFVKMANRSQSIGTARLVSPNFTGESIGGIANKLAKTTNLNVEHFELTDQGNTTFSSSVLDEKYWIANFIFSNCAGPCPVMTAALTSIQNDYPEENLRFVSISVDPTNDTPERLTEFGTQFNADFKRWSFLTGDYDDIQHLAGDVFLLALENPGEEAVEGVDPELRHTGPIIHSSRFILVGADGNIVDWYEGTEKSGQARLRNDLNAVFGPRDSATADEGG